MPNFNTLDFQNKEIKGGGEGEKHPPDLHAQLGPQHHFALYCDLKITTDIKNLSGSKGFFFKTRLQKL